MKSIIKAMLEEIYIKADEIAKRPEASRDEFGNYFITLQQLETILKEFEG
tara:strand:- start:395 stop:544 length:150 start_codon:yes stop_codon:yes gene_type:complete